jgi:hypothetical protein
MTLSSSRCLYCGETKPLSEFNKGHVMPQAFGRFEDNLVLHGEECIACNDLFGKTLELALARDSKEGLDRFAHGLVKPRKDGRRFGGGRIKFTNQGRFEGASLEIDPDAPSNELRLRPVREIGFGQDWEGPFRWFKLEDVPPVEELRKLGLVVATAGSMSAEDVETFLKARGLRVSERRCFGDPRDADGKISTTMRGQIDQVLMRSVAKIAFSYLAHEYPGIPHMPEFDEIRRYVRLGQAPMSFEPITISTDAILGGLPPDTQLLAHVVTVRWDPRTRRIVAQVTLLGWLQYQVTLSAAPFVIEPRFIDSGHAFNPFVRQIAKLTRNRRLSVPFWTMTKEEFSRWKAGGMPPRAA